MLNMASSGENVQDSTNENGDLHVSREDTVSLVKTIISSEFRHLKKQLLNTDKLVNYLKRKYSEEQISILNTQGTRNNTISIVLFC